MLSSSGASAATPIATEDGGSGYEGCTVCSVMSGEEEDAQTGRGGRTLSASSDKHVDEGTIFSFKSC